MKKYSLIVIAAVLVIFGAKNALADTYTSVTDLSWGQYQNGCGFWNPAIAGPYTATTTFTLGYISLSGHSNGYGGSGNDFYIYQDTTSTIYATDTSSTNLFGDGTFTAYFPGVVISAGHDYYIGGPTGYYSCGQNITVGGATFVGGGVFAPPTPSINFYIPAASTTANFPKWELLGSNIATDGTLYRFDVVYTQLGGATTYDDFNLANNYYDPAILPIPKSQSFGVGQAWYAQGFLFATSTTDATLAITDPGDAIASTTLFFFDIGTAATSTTSTAPINSICPTAPPIFELTGSLPYFKINNPIPSIISGGCNILLSGFVMDDAQSADINSRYSYAATVFGSKPPFGYFTLTTAAIGSFASGSSTIYLLNASATAAFAPITDPLDTGLAAAIGLLGLFWLLRRLKHVQP